MRAVLILSAGLTSLTMSSAIAGEEEERAAYLVAKAGARIYAKPMPGPKIFDCIRCDAKTDMDAVCRELPKLKDLRIVYINDVHLSVAHMQSLAKLPRVERLYLRGSKINSEGLKTLKHHNRLIELRLGSNKVDAAVMRELSGTSALRVLAVHATDDATVELAKLTDLERLDFHGPVTDKALSSVAKLKKLRELGLAANSKVTGEGLKELAPLKELISLNLTRSTIKDQDLVGLKKLRSLQSLSVAFTDITDDGLAHLLILENLQELHLGHTKVTNQGVVALTVLPHLRAIWVSSTRVDAEGVKEFREIRPDVVVSTN